MGVLCYVTSMLLPMNEVNYFSHPEGEGTPVVNKHLKRQQVGQLCQDALAIFPHTTQTLVIYS